MKTLIIACLLGFLCLSVKAQRIYVEKSENGCEQPIITKLLDNKIQVTFNKDSADYVLQCNVTKSWLSIATGSVSIISRNGQLIGKTKEAKGSPSAFNGYADCRVMAMQKVAEKYLLAEVDKIKK